MSLELFSALDNKKVTADCDKEMVKFKELLRPRFISSLSSSSPLSYISFLSYVAEPQDAASPCVWRCMNTTISHQFPPPPCSLPNNPTSPWIKINLLTLWVLVSLSTLVCEVLNFFFLKKNFKIYKSGRDKMNPHTYNHHSVLITVKANSVSC